MNESIIVETGVNISIANTNRSSILFSPSRSPTTERILGVIGSTLNVVVSSIPKRKRTKVSAVVGITEDAYPHVMRSINTNILSSQDDLVDDSLQISASISNGSKVIPSASA